MSGLRPVGEGATLKRSGLVSPFISCRYHLPSPSTHYLLVASPLLSAVLTPHYIATIMAFVLPQIFFHLTVLLVDARAPRPLSRYARSKTMMKVSHAAEIHQASLLPTIPGN